MQERKEKPKIILLQAIIGTFQDSGRSDTSNGASFYFEHEVVVVAADCLV